MDWMSPSVIAAAACVVAIGMLSIAWKPLRGRQRERETRQALRDFKLQRERLEAKFFDLAGGLGKPRGLRWLDCDWQHDVTFARAVDTGMLTAFVAVNIHFEAIEGGDMEDVEAVGTIRDAAAVFHYRRGVWGTGGRALFNMNPYDALERLQGQFEPVTVSKVA